MFHLELLKMKPSTKQENKKNIRTETE